MCSNVPDTFEVKMESRKQEVNIFKGTDSKGIGLKFDGSSVLFFVNQDSGGLFPFGWYLT